MKSKTVAMITGPTIVGVKQQIKQSIQHAELLELRLDKFSDLPHSDYQALIHSISTPVILTLRTKMQGGEFEGNEAQHLSILSPLLVAGAHGVDLSSELSLDLAKTLKQQFPMLHLIRSYHNFEETPQDLLALLESLKNPLFDSYKLVTFAQSSLDALRLLNLLKHQQNLTAHAMGEYGQFSRILAPVCGSVFCYGAIIAQHDVPGLMNLGEMNAVYNLKNLNSNTQIYGLLGNPIKHSLGHIYHNQKIQQYKRNAVYIKINLEVEDLASFFTLIKPLNCAGFSVTMPLKQAIKTYLKKCDDLSQQTEAVNTLTYNSSAWHGHNTDGEGAVRALQAQFSLTDKRALILGAGGSGARDRSQSATEEDLRHSIKSYGREGRILC